MAKVQASLENNMRDDRFLHFRPGVSNPDQENVLHLNSISHLYYRLAKTQYFNLVISGYTLHQ